MDKRELLTLRGENYNGYLKEAIVLRENTFALISGLAAAFLGTAATVLVSQNKVNLCLMILALVTLVFVSIFSLGIFIFGTRKSIKALAEKIRNLTNDEKSSEKKQPPQLGYELELLYIMFVIGITLFVMSIFLN